MCLVIRGQSPCSITKTRERPLKLDSHIPKKIVLFALLRAHKNDENFFISS